MKDGLKGQPEIKTKAPVFDVKEVKTGPTTDIFRVFDLTTVALHLSQTSYARFYIAPGSI